MHKKFFKLFLFSLLSLSFISCAVKIPIAKEKNILKLSQLLQGLEENITQEEAIKLSKELFTQTAVLAHTFQMTSPPQYHNFLVNVGLKEKGLCYHWSDTLYKHFNKQDYLSFEFHLMGVSIGEYWHEHNSLVVGTKGKKIEEGIVIDPWRYSGKLYFSKVKEDAKYQWQHRPSRGCKRQP